MFLQNRDMRTNGDMRTQVPTKGERHANLKAGMVDASPSQGTPKIASKPQAAGEKHAPGLVSPPHRAPTLPTPGPPTPGLRNGGRGNACV